MLSCPSVQDILMNHFQYPGQTRAKTMCHKCGWPYLGIQPTWCARPSPLSHASPGHWVLEYSGGGEAEEYKTGAFHLSPTVSRLSPSCKLWSALFFTPCKKQDVWIRRIIFRRQPIHEEVGWQRKGNPKRLAAPYSGFSWCLFICNYKKKQSTFNENIVSQCDLSLRPSVPKPPKVGNNHNSLWSIVLHSSPLDHLQRFFMLGDSFSN